MIYILKGFRTIVIIFIVISTKFRLMCPPAFFRCLLNLGTYTELGNKPFIVFWVYGISTFVGDLMPNPILNNQFYFKQFSLALVHSLIVKNISISSYSVYSNSSNSTNSV